MAKKNREAGEGAAPKGKTPFKEFVAAAESGDIDAVAAALERGVARIARLE